MKQLIISIQVLTFSKIYCEPRQVRYSVGGRQWFSGYQHLISGGNSEIPKEIYKQLCKDKEIVKEKENTYKFEIYNFRRLYYYRQIIFTNMIGNALH